MNANCYFLKEGLQLVSFACNKIGRIVAFGRTTFVEKQEKIQINDNGKLIITSLLFVFTCVICANFHIYDTEIINETTSDFHVCNKEILTIGSVPILTFCAIIIISSANRAIHFAWFSHNSGNPLTTRYLSPTVSTWMLCKRE